MLWDVADRAHPRRMGAFTGTAEAFSRDGRSFATTGSCTTDRAGFEVGCATTLWSVTDEARPSRTVAVSGADAVFSPDGHALVTRAAHDTVLLWSLADRRHPRRIATLDCGSDDRAPAAVVFSPDGGSLATGSEDGTVKLWHVDDPARFATLPPARSSPNSGQIGVSSTHTVVAFSPDGGTLTTIMGNDLATRWNVADPRRPTRTAVLRRETQGAGVVAFSPDATTVAGAGVDGANSVSLWRVATR